MNLLEQHFDAHRGDVIEVTLDRAARVRLVDATNLSRLRRGQSYQHHGDGVARRSPVRLPVPRSGRWHVLVDLGPRGGTIRAAARLLTA